MDRQEPKLSDALAQNRTDMASDRTDLAVERTLMAASRTLESWVRTGLSLIGFGFTLYKVLQVMAQEGILLTPRPEGPRIIGLFLIALGTLSTLMGGIEYKQIAKNILRKFGAKARVFPLIMSALIFVIGMWLFISIALKAEFF